MWRWLKSLMTKRQRSGERDVAVRRRRGKTLREGLESHTEAITFAEAGLQRRAREIIRARLAERAKVLVVGHEGAFSRAVGDYAAEFAERMGYEIVALSVTKVAADCPRGESAREHIREQFKTKCEEKISAFRQACEHRGIPLTHMVMFGEVEECIRKACEKLRRVECVITEPESFPKEGKVAVPVFCVTAAMIRNA